MYITKGITAIGSKPWTKQLKSDLVKKAHEIGSVALSICVSQIALRHDITFLTV